MAEPEQPKSLEWQLTQLAQIGIARVFDAPAKRREDVSAILEIAEQLYPDDWQAGKEGRTAAVKKTMQRAVEAVRPAPLSADIEITLRHAAKRLYAFMPIPSEFKWEYDRQKKPYSTLIKILKKEANRASDGSFDRKTGPVRTALAIELRKLVSPKPAATSACSDQKTPDGKYVHRPALETEVANAFDSGSHVVYLWGDVGTGKSELAKYLVRDRLSLANDAELPIVQADTEESLKGTLGLILRSAGLVVDGDLYYLKHQFKKMLVADLAPPWLILDGLETEEQYRGLVPEETAGNIVVTSRILPVEDEKAAFVAISEMSADEARKLAQLHAPTLTDANADAICRAVAYRPLAIKQAATCFAQSSSYKSVEDFCDALYRSTRRVLSTYASNADRSLAAAYRLTMENLERVPQVLELIDILAFLGPIFYEEMLPYVWSASSERPYRRAGESAKMLPEDREALHFAMNTAKRWGLVQNDFHWIGLHPLTTRIVRDIRQDHALDVANRAYGCLCETLGFEDWPGGEPFPSHWPHATVATARSIAGVLEKASSEDEKHFRRLSHLRAIALHDNLQFGRNVIFSNREPLVARMLHTGARNSPLLREALTLELLTEFQYDDKPWLSGQREDLIDNAELREVRELVPAAYLYEALFSGDLSPLADGYDTRRILLERAAEEEQSGRVRLKYSVDWFEVYAASRFQGTSARPLRGTAPYSAAMNAYGFGVMHFQRGELAEAEHCYQCGLHLFGRLGEARWYEIECLRRLAELEIRRGRLADAQQLLSVAEQIIVLVSNERYLAEDNLFVARYRQTRAKLYVEKAIRSVNAVAESSVGSLLDELRALAEIYRKAELRRPWLEAQFDMGRVLSLLPEDERTGSDPGIWGIPSECMYRKWKIGSLVAWNAYIKINLDDLRNEPATPADRHHLADFASSIAYSLRETAPFWSADALCTAYAAAIIGGLTDVPRYREIAEDACLRLGRADKLERAEAVAGGAPLTLLLAE